MGSPAECDPSIGGTSRLVSLGKDASDGDDSGELNCVGILSTLLVDVNEIIDLAGSPRVTWAANVYPEEPLASTCR